MSWHTDLNPECSTDHPSIEMQDMGAILHGQSRKYRCPICDREVLFSNTPQQEAPERRAL